MTQRPKAVLIVSGGLDSVTLAHLAASHGFDLHILSFDYGQRHRKELSFAKACADRLGARFDFIDLSSVRPLLGGSALTDDSVAVPDGHYAAPTMSQTVVANRNAIMLSIAWGAAVAEGAQLVGTAIHAGDHAIYPDCRPEFASLFVSCMKAATEGFGFPGLNLWTPFVHSTKAQIAAVASELQVPIDKTWSCYKGGDIHCGTCGTCYERREALRDAGVMDPTVYAVAWQKLEAPSV